MRSLVTSGSSEMQYLCKHPSSPFRFVINYDDVVITAGNLCLLTTWTRAIVLREKVSVSDVKILAFVIMIKYAMYNNMRHGAAHSHLLYALYRVIVARTCRKVCRMQLQRGRKMTPVAARWQRKNERKNSPVSCFSSLFVRKTGNWKSTKQKITMRLGGSFLDEPATTLTDRGGYLF